MGIPPVKISPVLSIQIKDANGKSKDAELVYGTAQGWCKRAPPWNRDPNAYKPRTQLPWKTPEDHVYVYSAFGVAGQIQYQDEPTNTAFSVELSHPPPFSVGYDCFFVAIREI